MSIPEAFGIWASTFDLWYSQAELNSDGLDHFLVFDGPGGGFAMGIEDVSGGGDNDFQDHVLFLKPVQPTELKVAFDVKPGSCPNPFNFGANGVLPAAILGSATFDVTEVDVATIRLEGVAPLRSAKDDVAAPFAGDVVDRDDCTTAGPDGFLDLTLKFDRRAVARSLGPISDRQSVIVHLAANLLDGTGVTGVDVLWIIAP